MQLILAFIAGLFLGGAVVYFFMKSFLRQEFQMMAQKIFDEKSSQLNQISKSDLENHNAVLQNVLQPLKERLKDFEKRVEDSYSVEAKERFALKQELQRMMELNQRMSVEANNLTQALKGDSKFQGDWGELVLQRILESTGLREGFEFEVQKEFTSDDGERFKPDVIVHLPENKHLIVDSKVSLKDYEGFVNTLDESLKEKFLKKHIDSLHGHIDDLAEKHYSKLKNIQSPDFVFLFVPIEAAYLLIMQNKPEIAQSAWKKNIAIVTATTLFTTLKTVASLWRIENQNRNAQEIAKEGGLLYDKFVGFFDDMELIGKSLEKTSQVHQEAINKLKLGPGNLIKKAEKLRELGASNKKNFRPDLLDKD